ncbi:uncharacterized protein B0I36DRAFT_327877 [Microdochium trichocladiopsis]|uniref:Uncharacterized protein n=1 Tax=Microdochium trichocladiopsis TaxID=1682393 RepID=A0A9P9BNT3_9PEZI|nr:uncharacterized protein B0I36DRAFT_327877 [Microdochium trichocladiopsis]KAH7027774.1 hypothetical protein B0I36DRAFT_327877 [Microdochium trichocladiopsis]
MQKFAYDWRKAINIPAWVIQFLVCIIYIGISAWALTLVSGSRTVVSGSLATALAAGAGINIGIGLLTALFDILEIVFIAKGVMKPAIYLSFACIKTLIWVILFILACLSAAAASILLTLAAAATCIAQLVYGSIVVHRNRKGTLRGGKYNAAATGHVEGQLYTPNTGSAQPPQTQGYENYSTGIPAPSGNYSQQGYGGASPYVPPSATEYKSPVPSPAPQHAQQAPYSTYAPPPNNQHGYYAPQQQYYGGPPAPAGSYELDNQVRH